MKKEIIVGMADLKVSKAPDIITTSLGSCIGVCLYSPTQKVGGILHLMMAYAGPAAQREGFKKAKFADTGIPELIHQLQAINSSGPKDYVAKIFGGGKILHGIVRNIGADNESAVRSILKDLGIRIVAARTGGGKGYRISLNLDTGKVSCRIFGAESEEF
ncbi:MAG: chemotaxis protein CheD [Candidatus Omnitrophica bacterium]|nr:chemotaxis protein CheD [Candidatus Omnitrophota bacterium]